MPRAQPPDKVTLPRALRSPRENLILTIPRAGQVPLDALYANAAASIRHAARVSVADAHIGAVVQAASADRITGIISDPADMRRMAGDRNVTVVTI